MVRAAVYDEFDYVLKCDRKAPHEEQTVFRLKPLTARESQDCSAAIRQIGYDFGQDGNEGAKVARIAPSDFREQNVRVVGWGLMGWTNFKTVEGHDVAFESDLKSGRRVLKEKVLDAVAPYLDELASAILNASELDEDQEKNS